MLNQHSAWLSHDAYVGVMEMHVGMALEPAVAFGLVRIENCRQRRGSPDQGLGDNVIHKTQELPATAASLAMYACRNLRGPSPYPHSRADRARSRDSARPEPETACAEPRLGEAVQQDYRRPVTRLGVVLTNPVAVG